MAIHQQLGVKRLEADRPRRRLHSRAPHSHSYGRMEHSQLLQDGTKSDAVGGCTECVLATDGAVLLLSNHSCRHQQHLARCTPGGEKHWGWTPGELSFHLELLSRFLIVSESP